MNENAGKVYLGPDGLTRSAADHALYLRECARQWRRLAESMGSSSGRGPTVEWANRVDAMAARIEAAS